MSLVHVVFMWKKRFVFREHAELLSCVDETQRETADEDTGRVNRGLQHPLTSLYILMGSCLRPLRQGLRVLCYAVGEENTGSSWQRSIGHQKSGKPSSQCRSFCEAELTRRLMCRSKVSFESNLTPKISNALHFVSGAP